MDISLNYTLRFIKSTKSNVKETHESNSMLLFKISTSAELMHPSPFLSLSLSKQESTWQPCHSGILFRKWQSNPRLVALSNFFFFQDHKGQCHLCAGTISGKLQALVDMQFLLQLSLPSTQGAFDKTSMPNF